MTDRCRHAARIGDMLFPCTVDGVHMYTNYGPEDGERDVHYHSHDTMGHAVSWDDGDVWDVVQPDPEPPPSVWEQATGVVAGIPMRHRHAGTIADALVEAGLLSEPCRHEPFNARPEYFACGHTGTLHSARWHAHFHPDCPGPHRTLFVEQEEGGS